MKANMKVSAGVESRQLASASEVLDREEPSNLVTMFSEGNPALELQVSTIDLTESAGIFDTQYCCYVHG